MKEEARLIELNRPKTPNKITNIKFSGEKII